MRHLLLRLDDSHGEVDVNNKSILMKRIQEAWKVDLEKNSDVRDGYVVYNGKIIERFKILGFQKLNNGSHRRILNVDFIPTSLKGKQTKFTHENYPNSVKYIDDHGLQDMSVSEKIKLKEMYPLKETN